jgi:hypothetical protein
MPAAKTPLCVKRLRRQALGVSLSADAGSPVSTRSTLASIEEGLSRYTRYNALAIWLCTAFAIRYGVRGVTGL